MHYVREIERVLKHCLKEHSRDLSPVGYHMDFHKHKLDTDNIKILDRESQWFQRGVRAALQIRSRSPSLNQDRGRHQLLPPIYNTLVRSRDVSMTAAALRDHLQS